MQLFSTSYHWSQNIEMCELALRLTKEIVSSLEKNMQVLSIEENEKWRRIHEDYQKVIAGKYASYHIEINPGKIEISIYARSAFNNVMLFFKNLMKNDEYRENPAFKEAKELLFIFLLN